MMRAKVTLERRDAELNLLQKEEFWSKSFTQNFINLLYCAFAHIQSGAPLAMTDISNTSRNIDSQSGAGLSTMPKGNLALASPGGDGTLFVSDGTLTNGGCVALPSQQALFLPGDLIGIQVGTNNTAVTPTDHALNTRVAHGMGAGLFQYGGCELNNFVVANPIASFDIRRYFTNQSGGTITITESGLYSPGTQFGNGLAWEFLVCRDVFAGVAVLNTQVLSVTYTIQISV